MEAMLGAGAKALDEDATEAAPSHCLPHLVLVKLFTYLGPRERLAAGQVCRSWQEALGAAPLWRSVRVVLSGPWQGGRGVAGVAEAVGPRGDEERAAAAVLSSHRFAPLVRRLELRWARPIRSPGHGHHGAGHGQQAGSVSAAASTAPTLYLLEALRAAGQAGRLQLGVLHLHDLVMGHKLQRGRLLAGLAAFLGSQRQLQTLSLQNACLGVSEGLRVLVACARRSASTLSDLRLHAAFREWQAPHASLRLSRLLRRLTPLSSLSLDYPALSDGTLLLLAECCAGLGHQPGLRRLSIAVRDTDNRQHSLSEDAWRRLAAACPHLRVALNIENLGHYEDICGLLHPSVPLQSFRLYSGPVWDQSRSRDFRATLRRLTSNYFRSLECVQLHLKNSREQLDDLVMELLKRCRLLITFQFDGVLRHLDTIKDICRLRLEAVINFQTIHVRPKISNNLTRTIAKEISATFKEALSEKTVDFQIDVPTR